MFNKKKSINHGLTFISKNCSIQGELDILGDILLDGNIDGILKSDSTITVGAHGELTGFVSGNKITIAGSVEGDLECGELHIEKTGVLRGNIICNTINIANGGQFFGQRLSQTWDATAKLKAPSQQDNLADIEKANSIKDINSPEDNCITIENKTKNFA